MQKRGLLMRLADPFCCLAFPVSLLFSGSMRTLYALCKYSTLLRQSVLLFMRTIFDSLIINHHFGHFALQLTFLRRSRIRTALSGRALYFSCWTALSLDELLSTLHLVSYSFDYSSYFCPFPARRLPWLVPVHTRAPVRLLH
jgi:hypothetical protein